MAESEDFTIHPDNEGQWAVHWPAGSLLAVYSSREEAELVASTPELTRKCQERSDWSLPLAYHIEYVLGLCEGHGSCPAWRLMRGTVEDIKKAVTPKHPAYEKWAADLMRPRRMWLRPFKDRGKALVVNGPNPLPDLHTLTDDEVEVFQQWFPEYQPGDPILNDLEAVLLHDLQRSAAELPEFTVPQIAGLLRRTKGDARSMKPEEQRESVTIFYSWQADLPNHLNRGFIRNALDEAAGQLSTSADIKARIDQDTQGLPGSPDVFNAILAKIKGADAFVCDVSLVGFVERGEETTGRHMVNPNVLVELGYALAVLGPERIVMVFNEAFGNTRDLPFDLGFKRQVVYRAEGDKGVDRSTDRKTLASNLKQKIEDVIRVVQRDRMVRQVWDRLQKFQRSFVFLREKLGAEYTDEFLGELLDSHPVYFVSASIKSKGPGLRRAPNAPPAGPGRAFAEFGGHHT